MRVERNVVAQEQTETIPMNDENGLKKKRGFGSVSRWRKRAVPVAAAAVAADDTDVADDADASARAVETNAPKGILRSLDHTDNTNDDEDRSVCTNASIKKKVTWDSSVRDNKKLYCPAVINAFVADIKFLVSGLDSHVQHVKETMQCGNSMSKDFFCPSDGNDIVFRTCGNMVDRVDGVSLGTNSLVDDNTSALDENTSAHATESREDILGDDQFTESREETEDRYEAVISEDEVPTSTFQSNDTSSALRKKTKRDTVLNIGSALNYYAGKTLINPGTSISRAAATPTSNIQSQTQVVKALHSKLSTHLLQNDESVISALTDPTMVLEGKKTKRHRYTTLQPKQSKTDLKGKIAKPIKFMSAGLASHMKTRKMITFRSYKC
jgi:hypothetical protein